MIAARNMGNVAGLDTEQMPEEREARLKNTILEKQLFRKIYGIIHRVSMISRPLAARAGSLYKKGHARWRGLERMYKFHSTSPLPDTSEKNVLRASEMLEKAAAQIEEGKFKEAEETYLSVIKLDPQNVEAFEGLGKTYLKMGQMEEAKETFEHIVKHWSERDLSYACLAQIAAGQNDWPQAKDLYLHALSINNQPVEYHVNLAEVYRKLDDNEKAFSSLQKAQTLEPNNPKILNQLLDLSIILKNKVLAEEILLKIKTVNPDHGKLDELDKRVKDL